MRGGERTGQTESDKSDGFSRDAHSISRGESGLVRLAELGELGGLARRRTGQAESDRVGQVGPRERGVFPKCQCSLCHDWFRGEDGSDISDISDGSDSVGRVGQCRTGRTGGARGVPKCQCSLCHDCGNRLPGGAVMAPLRRAGLTGSLLVQGNRSDLRLRGREGCREGLPFRSVPLRAADRAAGRGRGSATGGLGDGSRW